MINASDVSDAQDDAPDKVPLVINNNSWAVVDLNLTPPQRTHNLTMAH
jgi:hypothetical protein